jgi:hypothetical protein
MDDVLFNGQPKFATSEEGNSWLHLWSSDAQYDAMPGERFSFSVFSTLDSPQFYGQDVYLVFTNDQAEYRGVVLVPEPESLQLGFLLWAVMYLRLFRVGFPLAARRAPAGNSRALPDGAGLKLY